MRPVWLEGGEGRGNVRGDEFTQTTGWAGAHHMDSSVWWGQCEATAASEQRRRMLCLCFHGDCCGYFVRREKRAKVEAGEPVKETAKIIETKEDGSLDEDNRLEVVRSDKLWT